MSSQVTCKAQVRSLSQPMVYPKDSPKNPLRILEPRRNRLTSLKAERVLVVLEENIKNIQIVLTLPDILECIERFSVSIGQQLCIMIQEQQSLRIKYEHSIELLEEGEKLELEFQEYLKLKEKQGSLFSETSSNSKSEASNTDEEHVTRVNGQTLSTLRNNVVMVKKGLSNSIRTILRKFRANPSAMKTILEQTQFLTGAKMNFINKLELLHGVVRARLLTTPGELEEKKYYIAKVVQRENKIYKMKEKLQAEYDLQLKIKSEEAKKQLVEIEMLKEALVFINETATTEFVGVMTDATKRITADTKSSEGKHKEMLQKCVDLNKSTLESLANNFAEEREKRKRKFKLSTEVFNWIQKYDADMGTRQDNHDELVYETDGIKKDLDDLGRHFLVLEQEYLGIMQARKLAAEAEQERIQDLERKTVAVIRIQACWRGYRTRKMLKNKNKKEKKGKKK